jgi:hypothetical protein
MNSTTRRAFLQTTLATACSHAFAAQDSPAPEPVIDIHQHMNYHLRSDEHLLLHQQVMGATTSIILPAGTYVSRPSTHDGKSNGLAAKCATTEAARDFAKAHADSYLWACNEVTDLDTAPAELEKWLKQGACMIAEQKFKVECDSPESQKLYELAAAYNVPILLHFQHLTYNLGYDRFHTMLAKYPKTNFIGHAQAFWGNIDRQSRSEGELPQRQSHRRRPHGSLPRRLPQHVRRHVRRQRPAGPHARRRAHARLPGASSGQNPLRQRLRRPPRTRPRLPGRRQTLATLRKLAANKAVERKILFENAKKLFRL